MHQVNILLEVSTEVDRSHSLKLGETVDVGELGVVDDAEVTTNLLEKRERNVGELLVVDEGDGIRDLGQVGGEERLEVLALVQLQGSTDGLEEGDTEGLGIGDLDLLTRLEVGHVNLHVLSVLVDDELGGDVDEAGLELGQALVVVDFEAVDRGELEAAKVVDPGVGNDDSAGLGDALGTEGQGAKVGKLDHFELVDAAERVHLDAVELLQRPEFELAPNRVEGAAANGKEVDGILDDEVTLDLLRAIEEKLASNTLVDSDCGIDNLAVEYGVGFLDLDVLGAGLGCDEFSG